MKLYHGTDIQFDELMIGSYVTTDINEAILYGIFKKIQNKNDKSYICEINANTSDLEKVTNDVFITTDFQKITSRKLATEYYNQCNFIMQQLLKDKVAFVDITERIQNI